MPEAQDWCLDVARCFRQCNPEYLLYYFFGKNKQESPFISREERIIFTESSNFLAPFALEDNAFAEAYACLGAEKRATLKTVIARLYDLWAELPKERVTSRTGKGQLRFVCGERAAPYAFFFCPHNYSSAPGLLAAVLPALLAGVEQIIPCFYTAAETGFSEPAAYAQYARQLNESTGSKEVAATTAFLVNPSLLTALELVGVPEAYLLPSEVAVGVLNACAAHAGVGRVVSLGDVEAAAPLLLSAHAAEVPCISLSRQPSYSQSDIFTETDSTFSLMATYAKEEHSPLWLWPELEPAWFRNKCHSFL